MRKITFALLLVIPCLFMMGCCGFNNGCCGAATTYSTTNCCGNDGW